VRVGAESFDYLDHLDLLGLAERCYHASVLQRYQDEKPDVNDVGPGAFEVIPAIDLRAGRVVRLVEGDFGRERVFADDPGSVADAFATAGGRRVHVVDLDGARGDALVLLLGAQGMDRSAALARAVLAEREEAAARRG